MAEYKFDLEQLVGTYFHGNNPQLGRFKKLLARNENKPWPEQFKNELLAMIEGKSLLSDDFGRLTNLDFDTPEEYKALLREIWAYLYAEGKNPIPH